MTLGQLKIIFKSFYFEAQKTCDYILQQLYEVIKYLVEDQPGQIIRLNAKEKLSMLNRLILTTIRKPKEDQVGKPDPNSIFNLVSTLFLDFLESQPNILSTEQLMRHYDKLFMLNFQCSVEIRQR